MCGLTGERHLDIRLPFIALCKLKKLGHSSVVLVLGGESQGGHSMVISTYALATALIGLVQSAGVTWVPLGSAQHGPEKPVAASTPATPAIPPQTAAPVSTVTTPAPAPAPVTVNPSPMPAGRVLWRNIEDGMSVAELRALYPQGAHVTYKADRTVLSDVPVIEGCQAKVNIYPFRACTSVCLADRLFPSLGGGQ